MTAKISRDTNVDGVQHCADARSDTAPALALPVRFAADLAAGAHSSRLLGSYVSFSSTTSTASGSASMGSSSVMR